jgi:uncharacterized protein YbaR (Trm112 family)
VKVELVERLICPECHGPLQLTPRDWNEAEVIEGTLLCDNCGLQYPVVDGIPHLANTGQADRYGHWDEVWLNTSFELTSRRLELAWRREGVPICYALPDLAQRIGLEEQDCLEIGCGAGSYSLLLAKMGVVRVPFLVDISPMGLQLTRKVFAHFGIDCHLILADALALPFRTADFDLALSGGLIEHFFGPSRHQAIKEHCRVARQVLCQVPLSSVPYWTLRTIITLMNRGWPFGPEKPFSFRELQQLLEQEGYVIRSFSYHDLLTAGIFLTASWFHSLPLFTRKRFVNSLFRHEIVFYATEEQ